jgi:hypothetical protein
MKVDFTPILSICIPTYNRALLLQDALESIREEVIGLGDDVEVVVSDNCSTDQTVEVLKQNEDWVRWSSSDRTRGITTNLMRVTCDLARGRFVWLVGDDDLVLRGAVTRVVNSLKQHPEISYHYLNFGWLEVDQRKDVIREAGSNPALFPAEPGKFQTDEFRTMILPRIEDLVFLPSNNPSAVFGGIFCFTAHRDIFLSQRDRLHPSDILDGSTTVMDDIFAHALVTLPVMAGKPVVYVGMPCLLQGIGGWEWAKYANKMMIFGTHQLFTWLEGTDFAPDAMARLWESYHTMAGWLIFQMLHSPALHQGLDIVLPEAIPAAAGHLRFWEAVLSEARGTWGPSSHGRSAEASLAEWVSALLTRQPDARVGLWGITDGARQLLDTVPGLRESLVWAADREESRQGAELSGTTLRITDPATLGAADLDVLVVGAGVDWISEIVTSATPHMRRDGVIATVLGLVPVNEA